MNKLYLYVIVFLKFSNASTQAYYDYNWMFSSDAKPMIISFNDHSVSSLKENITNLMRIGSANMTMSDAQGNLLFYSNGCSIFNAQHQIIKDGDGLNKGSETGVCPDYYSSGNQSMIGIPAPGRENQYYIFYENVVFIYEPKLSASSKGIYYALVDFSETTGKIVKKNNMVLRNIPLIADTSIYNSELCMIRQFNSSNWWLLVPKKNDDKIIKFLITSDSILGPYYQKIGLIHSFDNIGGGSSCFTPDGTKYLRMRSTEGFSVYDFDRSTGELSNYKYLPVASTGLFAGVSASPNSRYTYLSNHREIYQVDLSRPDLKDGLILLDTFNWIGSPKPPFFATFNYSQLGPDCRIYIGSGNGINQLNVILYPDRSGKECTLVQQGLTLVSHTSGSLPHFPNYRIDHGPVCDSSIRINLTKALDLESIETSLIIYPNPAKNLVNIIYSQECVIFLYNAHGSLISKFRYDSPQEVMKINLDNLDSGVYYIKAWVNDIIVEYKKLIVY